VHDQGADSDQRAMSDPTADPVPEAEPEVKRRPRPTPGAGVDLAARLAAAEAARQQAESGERPSKPTASLNVTRKIATSRVREDGAPKTFLERSSADDDAEDDHRIAEPAKKVKQRRIGSGGRLVIIIVIAAIAAFGLRSYVVAPYYIPSASMEPTLHGCDGCNNDHVLVDKLSYHLHSVHRGDIVVFNRPKSWPANQVREKVLIKRVIGLPGDVLSLQQGSDGLDLYVNGQELSEPYVRKACGAMTSLGPDGGPALTKTAKVPSGDVFVMGDNRCNSLDSRTFGPIPQHDIVGRAFLIIWPLKRVHSL
jgi:signal peptidase I